MNISFIKAWNRFEGLGNHCDIFSYRLLILTEDSDPLRRMRQTDITAPVNGALGGCVWRDAQVWRACVCVCVCGCCLYCLTSSTWLMQLILLIYVWRHRGLCIFTVNCLYWTTLYRHCANISSPCLIFWEMDRWITFSCVMLSVSCAVLKGMGACWPSLDIQCTTITTTTTILVLWVVCRPLCAHGAGSFVTGPVFTWWTQNVIILFLLY